MKDQITRGRGTTDEPPLDLDERAYLLTCRCGSELNWHVEGTDWHGPVSVTNGYLVVDHEDFRDPWGLRDYYPEGLYCPGCREFISCPIALEEAVDEYMECLSEAGIRFQSTGG